ncbi:LON peptidase N-terminal domain and RING finger protein 3-like [Cololabis saira]|uniref:LON peptidase N-terminal domain and RING finger protein 3-like n=1 Tax=Cololabis saira TaxID=129043 RepID=UPI002AD4F7D9|nr:LON peptidase N-terminal domain and RING finger protein 3-like [Cololabis saira]
MGTEEDTMLRIAATATQTQPRDLSRDLEPAAAAHECRPAGLGDPQLLLALGGHRLQPGTLARLVDHLSDSVRVQSRGDRGEQDRGSRDPELSCGLCLSFLFEPVTLPCGHCYCKRCLERERREKGRPAGCRRCPRGVEEEDAGSPLPYRVTVVLGQLLARLAPALQLAGRLRREGNGLYAERRMAAALDTYDRAVLIAPTDHILFSNRSQIHSTLKHHEKALRDAEVACRLMPRWSRGHARKAQALTSLGRTEEALREYLVCLSIEPDCRSAKSDALKLLSDFLAPLSDQVPERISDFANMLSSRAHVKTGMGASFQTLSPSSLPSASSLSLSVPAPETPVDSPEQPESRRIEPCLPIKRKRRNTEEDEEHQGKKWRPSELPAEHRHALPTSRTGCSPPDPVCPEPAEAPGSLGSVVGDLLDPLDLECSLCMRLFYEPVTTPCGHTFCLRCLERCLDHNPKCPLCKEELSEYLVQRQYCKTVLVENLISKYLPAEFRERQKIHQEEMAEFSNLNKNVPIFVCTMAFPTVPCPLHIFEPCYRLMIRRCMETGTNCFGMCLGNDLNGYADYGCLLDIRDVKFFSDGRSVVDTIGRRRFKVIRHSERDGYNTADIEYLEDVTVEGEAERELQSLHDAVYNQALVWVNSLKAEQKERIEGHFGPMPEKDPELQASPNGPSWCWWLIAVLPLEGRAQLQFLAINSLKDRLSGIRKVLLFMAQSKHR